MVRVLPDVSGLSKEFDYLVPARWADRVEVGTLVRVDLHGRRVAAWITALDVAPPPGVSLRAVTKVSSVGPSADVVDLANWAAHRWAGRPAAVLRTASPPRAVSARPAPRADRPPAFEPDPLAAETLSRPEVVSVRVAPTDDQYRFVVAAAQAGPCLVITPTVGRARWLAGRLGRDGVRAHLQPGAWASGASGGVVIGARSAVLAPTGPLAAVVVLDEHDESLQEERNPTWHGRDIAIERARRAGAPCVLVSPVPSLAALAVADRVVVVGRSEERRGWPPVDVVDRRDEEPGRGGLFSERAGRLLRDAERAIVVLNRKGRAVMLACSSCGELVRTEDGNHLMVEQEGRLVAPATGEERPLICAVCNGTGLKRLRLGVTRAAEELSRLIGRPVEEVSAGSRPDPEAGQPPPPVILGTEAALHTDIEPDVVAFLDFDQELHAPRYRAAEQAMGLLARAARLAGGRRPEARIVVQTRSPEHRVLRAATAADPGLLVDEELAFRQALGFPPAGALAEVGGPGAADALAPLLARADVAVLGPRDDGRYLVRADGPDQLAEALTALERTKERVRVAVDPPRA